jgi:hypothetical protein
MTEISKNTQVPQYDKNAVMRSAKVRMWKIDSVLSGTYYRIEVKKWYGWVQPSISYSEDGQFYSLKEAEKWFKYLSGEKDIKVLYAVS